MKIVKNVEVIIENSELYAFSLLCKTMLDDARSRLTEEQFKIAKAFAINCLNNNNVWAPDK